MPLIGYGIIFHTSALGKALIVDRGPPLADGPDRLGRRAARGAALARRSPRVTAAAHEATAMKAAHEVDDPHHVEHESTGVENRKLAMWAFLSSEFLFFGALITNYLLYSSRDFARDRPRPRSTTSLSRRSAPSCC